MNKSLSMVLLSLSLFAFGCSEVDASEPDTGSVASALTAEEEDVRKAGKEQHEYATDGEPADVRKAGKEQEEYY